MFRFRLALALTLISSSALARPIPPKLLVVISIDQFSADLFAEYRGLWAHGMKRLAQGVVFPSGYQSHAATETCPGHSTILTGDHPARTGVIANGWTDQSVARADKHIYCAEDETIGASSKPGVYVPSPVHLRVPTLGDLMKTANSASRVVSVAGKDRAAIMMGGHRTDQIWFLNPKDYSSFITLADHQGTPVSVDRANRAIVSAQAKPALPMPLSPACAARSRAVTIGATPAAADQKPAKVFGDGRFARAAGDKKLFRASPESDAATIGLAGDLIAEMHLGDGPATDLIAIGASSTDVIGHAYGTEGSEMCLQLTALDAALGKLFDRLDAAHIDYGVVLTADHGGHDAPERNVEDALPDAQRIDPALNPTAIGTQIAKELGLSGSALYEGEATGDVWVDKAVPADKRAAVITRAKALIEAFPQVAAVFTGDMLAAAPHSTTPPETWTLAQRAAASYVPGRSGDLVVLSRPRVTPITLDEAMKGYIATHGSAWDYDRRVPILFWRKGMTGFEQPNGVETVDIAPTLAAWIGLPIAAGAMDGRCLDLIAGPDTICPTR